MLGTVQVSGVRMVNTIDSLCLHRAIYPTVDLDIAISGGVLLLHSITIRNKIGEVQSM